MSFSPPGSKPGTSAAAASVAGMFVGGLRHRCDVLVLRGELHVVHGAVGGSEQLPEMPHCQEPPPIFGPLPKSGAGQEEDVVAELLASVDRGPACRCRGWRDLPFMKSLAGSAPDFSGMYASVTRLRNHVAQASAFGPVEHALRRLVVGRG